MKLIEPVVITDAMLVSSTLTETDYPVWNAGTAYAADQRVIRLATHSVYQRVTAGTTATPPESDPVNWVRVGPTNRWAMFDQATGTVSSAAGSLSFTVAPGMVRALALLDLQAAEVTVTMSSGGTPVYFRTVDLNTGYGVSDWDAYFFAPIVRKTTLVLDDLTPYGDGQITVTVTGGGTVSVGTVAVGRVLELGGTRYGMSLGIIDYSVKTTDEWGTTTVTERSYAKRMTVPVAVASADVDEVARRLSLLRATPVVWIGAQQYDQSVVYGFARDWSIDIAYPVMSLCSVQIEGLA